MAPLRVAHNLTDRQRQILQAIAGERERQFAHIRAQIDPAVADRTLRDDLLHLKRLGRFNNAVMRYVAIAPILAGQQISLISTWYRRHWALHSWLLTD